jgi:hypothetical protein
MLFFGRLRLRSSDDPERAKKDAAAWTWGAASRIQPPRSYKREEISSMVPISGYRFSD